MIVFLLKYLAFSGCELGHLVLIFKFIILEGKPDYNVANMGDEVVLLMSPLMPHYQYGVWSLYVPGSK